VDLQHLTVEVHNFEEKV